LSYNYEDMKAYTCQIIQEVHISTSICFEHAPHRLVITHFVYDRFVKIVIIQRVIVDTVSFALLLNPVFPERYILGVMHEDL
jgi:hypothetical protein